MVIMLYKQCNERNDTPHRQKVIDIMCEKILDLSCNKY